MTFPTQGGENWKRGRNQRKRQGMQTVGNISPSTRAYSSQQTTRKLSIPPVFMLVSVLWRLSHRNGVMNGAMEQETTGYTNLRDERILDWQAHAYLPWSRVCFRYWLKSRKTTRVVLSHYRTNVYQQSYRQGHRQTNVTQSLHFILPQSGWSSNQ